MYRTEVICAGFNNTAEFLSRLKRRRSPCLRFFLRYIVINKILVDPCYRVAASYHQHFRFELHAFDENDMVCFSRLSYYSLVAYFIFFGPSLRVPNVCLMRAEYW